MPLSSQQREDVYRKFWSLFDDVIRLESDLRKDFRAECEMRDTLNHARWSFQQALTSVISYLDAKDRESDINAS